MDSLVTILLQIYWRIWQWKIKNGFGTDEVITMSLLDSVYCFKNVILLCFEYFSQKSANFNCFCTDFWLNLTNVHEIIHYTLTVSLYYCEIQKVIFNTKSFWYIYLKFSEREIGNFFLIRNVHCGSAINLQHYLVYMVLANKRHLRIRYDMIWNIYSALKNEHKS